MTDQEHVAARAVPALDFGVDLGHQRADRIDHPQAACIGGKFDRPGRAVGGQHCDRACWNIVDFPHEDRAKLLQPFHHRAVVDNRAAHVNRRAMAGQGLFHGIDRTLNPGAEPARIGQQDPPRRLAFLPGCHGH